MKEEHPGHFVWQDIPIAAKKIGRLLPFAAFPEFENPDVRQAFNARVSGEMNRFFGKKYPFKAPREYTVEEKLILTEHLMNRARKKLLGKLCCTLEKMAEKEVPSSPPKGVMRKDTVNSAAKNQMR